MQELKGFSFIVGTFVNTAHRLSQLYTTSGRPHFNDSYGIPVRLSAEAGYIRDWCDHMFEMQTTVRIRPAKERESSQAINGLLIAFYGDDSWLTDTTSGIHEKIPIEFFQPLGWQALPEHVPFAHVFQTHNMGQPNIDNPILQSFLDTCLNGYLEYGESFAVEFLETTIGWSKFWINDRSLARRPWIHEKNYKLLDDLLAKYPAKGNTFSERKLETGYPIYFLQQNLEKPKDDKEIVDISFPNYTRKLLTQAVHFIFGYGSLINAPSRFQTNPESKDAIPVRVSSEFGYLRTWNFHGPTSKLTALGVRKIQEEEEKSAINGVIYPVNGDDMNLVDEREEGYVRVKVPWEFVARLSWPTLPDTDQTQLWMYVPENPALPNFDYPILQTYVDVCINGCLDYDEQYAIEFLETTFGWNQFWLNDRMLARRPWIHCPNYQAIDRLLAEYPKNNNAFQQRKLAVEYAVLSLESDSLKKDPA